MRLAVAIISAIAMCAATTVAGTSQLSSNAREPGIYIETDGTLTMVSSTVVDKASPGGVMANAASLGFKGVDIKSKIPGSKSDMRITSATPVFLFRGDQFKASEFVLVKVETKDDRREFKTGKVGLFGRTKSEVDKDAVVKVKSSKLEDTSWRVVPEKTLAPGEYAFIISTALPERVWSFGVD
jgi:hypothetical protein